MSGDLHLIKLCVGAESVDDLVKWQKGRMAQRKRKGQDPRPRHVTRMWPKRAGELLDGGSLYWVFKGMVLARQPIEELCEFHRKRDGARCCEIVMSPGIIRVEARPRRPFQGWRYLDAQDAPPDLPDTGSEGADLPIDLARTLNDLGVVSR